MQPYIDSDILRSEQIAMLFNMRANTIYGFKMFFVFVSMNINDTMCKLGCKEEDALQHCMNCSIISQKIGRISSVNIDGIFATEMEQKILVSEFMLGKDIRTYLIEENRGAYQGYQILDTSTPAKEGGAGDRGGLLAVTQYPNLM